MIDRTINVTDATLVGDFTLRVLFDDGTVQTIDFGPFLRHSNHPAVRVFLAPSRFQSFRIEYGDLVWGDYELCFPVSDLYRNDIMKERDSQAVA